MHVAQHGTAPPLTDAEELRDDCRIRWNAASAHSSNMY